MSRKARKARLTIEVDEDTRWRASVDAAVTRLNPHRACCVVRSGFSKRPRGAPLGRGELSAAEWYLGTFRALRRHVGEGVVFGGDPWGGSWLGRTNNMEVEV